MAGSGTRPGWSGNAHALRADGRTGAIQETALTFAKERIAPNAAEWDEKCHFPVDVIKETAALGMATIYVPPSRAARACRGSTAR